MLFKITTSLRFTSTIRDTDIVDGDITLDEIFFRDSLHFNIEIIPDNLHRLFLRMPFGMDYNSERLHVRNAIDCQDHH